MIWFFRKFHTKLQASVRYIRFMGIYLGGIQQLQGVTFRNGLYELALTDENVQVRLGLNMVLEC